MIKREKKRKLRGSVLLTVVCVMSLLIVFLFGTLALATAANNRAHVNYSTAQTGVTSRTVVDAAVKAMEANPDYANAVSALKFGSGVPLTVKVELGAVPDSGKYGKTSPVFINAVGKKKFYDDASKTWVEGDIVQFSATVSMAGVDSTTNAYIVKQPPGTENGTGGGGAGFVTTAGAALTCQINLYGGTYINVPTLDDAEKFDYRYRSDDEYANNWDKNSATYDESLYRQFAPYGTGEANTFVLDNGGAVAECDLYVNNNMFVDDWSGFIFPEEGKGITVWGDLVFGNGGQSYISNVSTTETTDIDFNKIPYIYVDGEICQGANTDIKLGEAGKPMNIFCGSIDTNNKDAASNLKIAGDIYCMNPDKKSKIGGQNDTVLYNWSANVITKSKSGNFKHIASSIYSKGSLELKKITIGGNVRVEGDCTIASGVTIDGDLVVGGTLNIDNDTKVNGTVYYNPEKNSFTNEDPIEKEDIKTVNADYHGERYVLRDGLLELENEKRYYYQYQPQMNMYWEFIDLFGNIAHEPWQTYYYTWQNDKNPDDLATAEADAATNGTTVDYTQFFINNPYIGDWNRPNNGVDYDNSYYYVETDIVINEDGTYSTTAKSVKTDKKTFLYDETSGTKVDANDFSNFVKIEAYKSVKDADGNEIKLSDLDPSLGYSEHDNQIYVNKKTGAFISKTTAQNVFSGKKQVKREYKKISDSDSKYKINDIYPRYAEREVILGLEDLEGHELKLDDKGAHIHKDGSDSSGCTKVDDTKIVKTMEEVLKSVANPYKDGTLNKELSVQKKALIENTVEGENYFTTFEQITNKFNRYAKDVKEDGSYTVVAGVPSGSIAKKDIGAIISEDCILNMSFDDDYTGNYLIFEPGTKDMLVVVNKMWLDNVKVIVNDSQGGTVNFQIEKNGEADSGVMHFNNEGSWIAPSSYLKKFAETDKTSISFGGGGDSLELEDLGRPKINIYGESGTTLSGSDGASGFIANVVSPSLKFEFSAGNGTPSFATKFSNIYYNGREIANDKPLILGCVNSSFANIPNTMNVIFVTDSEDDIHKIKDPNENGVNYRILYYDEY